MAIIRLERRQDGIKEYLLYGRKQGNGYTRDQLDKRVSIWGDLNRLDDTIQYSLSNKRWKANYLNIVIGFTDRDWQQIKDQPERWPDMVKEQLNHYFPAACLDNIIAYAELHLPKIQRGEDVTTGAYYDRHYHLHISACLFNPETGNQHAVLPYHQHVDAAWQSLWCNKHGFDDPKDHRRAHLPSLEELIGRYRAVSQNTEKPTSTNSIRRVLRDYLMEKFDPQIKTRAAVEEWLHRQPAVKEVRWVNTQRNRYFKVTFQHDRLCREPVTLNVRGKGLEAIERCYYQPQEVMPSRLLLTGSKISSPPSPASLQKCVDNYTQWFLESRYQKKPKQSPRPVSGSQYHQKQQLWLAGLRRGSRKLQQIAMSLIQRFRQWKNARLPVAYSVDPELTCSALDAAAQRIRVKQRLQHKSLPLAVFNRLPAVKLLTLLEARLKLEPSRYEVTEQNNIRDRRNPALIYSTLEFLTNRCHLEELEIQDLLAPLVAETHRQQEQQTTKHPTRHKAPRGTTID